MKLATRRSIAAGAALTMVIGSSACQKKKSSAAAPTKDDGTTTTESKQAKQNALESLAASGAITPGSLALVSSLELFPQQAAPKGASLADFEDDTKKTRFQTRDTAVDAKSTIDMIMCFLSNTGYTNDAVRNTGPYIARVDMGLCGDHGGGGSTSSGPTFTNMIVDSKGPDTDHATAKIWFLDAGSSSGQLIKMSVLIGDNADTAADPTYSNIMRVQFNFYPMTGNTPSDTSIGNGVLKILKNKTKPEAFVKFAYTQTKDATSSERTQFSATVQLDKDNKPIGGWVHVDTDNKDSDPSGGAHEEKGQFTAAFDNDKFLAVDAVAGKSLCKDLKHFTYNIYQYGLYDAASHGKVKMKGGFPIKYAKADGTTDHAYVGYYGIWTQSNKALDAGTVVTKEDYSNSGAPAQTFTVVSGPGKLTKSVRKPVDLKKSDLGPFNAWSQNGQQQVEWQVAKNAFVVVGTKPQTADWNTDFTPVSPPTAYTLNPGFNQMMYDMSSNSLVVMADASGAPLNAYVIVQEDVTSSAGDLTLYCVNQCPSSNISQAQVDAQVSMMNNQGGSPGQPGGVSVYLEGTTLAKPATYTYNQANMILNGADGNPVALAAGVSWPAKTSDFSPGGSIMGGQMVDAAGLKAAQDAAALAAASAPQQQCGPQGGQNQGGQSTGGDQGTGTGGGQGTGSGQGTGTQMAGGDGGGGGGGGGGGCGGGGGGDPLQGTADVTYQWMTGQDSYSQFTGLKAADGTMVTFDAPLSISYIHSAAFDAEGKTDSAAFGKAIFLQWDGSNLSGIPGAQDKTTGYWKQAFSISSGATLGDTNQYVLAALEGERYMKDLAATDCAALDPSKAPELPVLDAEFSDATANKDAMPDAAGLKTLIQNKELLGQQ